MVGLPTKKGCPRMHSYRSLWLAAVTVLAGAVLMGCSTGPSLPPASNISAAASSTPASEYIIGPGDVLDIFVWHNTDLTRQMPVRPDGRISMPLIGDMTAVGKTPVQLAGELQVKLKPFVNDPLVTVIPTSFVGLFTRQIRVVGEAIQPRAIPFRSNMTVLDVMIEVGGLTKYADGDRAVLVRATSGKQQSYQVHLDSLVRDGNVSQNVDMQPGDILIIPQRFF